MSPQFTKTNVCMCVCLCTLQVLACGIVQLVMAVTPQKKEWRSHSSGVLCLVQDKSVHSTFMRLYCVKVKLTDNKKNNQSFLKSAVEAVSGKNRNLKHC